jgi:GMP synthase (glutamine-hydrolysing)
MFEKIIILDFGSQTTQLIARRLRELGEYCEILPYNKFPAADPAVKGVILSGSPFSVYHPSAFRIATAELRGSMPLLGICYGAQLMAHDGGGTVEPANSREYGRASLSEVDASDPLLRGVEAGSQIWMSHGDSITRLPRGGVRTASTADVPFAAFRIEGENTWGLQFHPEVYHTAEGLKILSNFLDICGARREWSAASFVETTVAELRLKLGSDKVVLALSGGVDSSVAAVLLSRATGENLHCVFVDHGLLRKNEFENVMKHYEHLGLRVTGVDARAQFYRALAGVEDPEKKRKIIGAGFIEIFDREAAKLKDVKWLAQGTIYPDCIESLSITGNTIKSHHNVGGLPEKMKLQLVEPLRLLFKDEVRRVGNELGMMPHLVNRQPFPGPGLAVRILGEVTEEKVKTLQEADDIFITALREWNLYDQVWQAGVILLPVRSVGVMGDERSYENAVALRAVTSTDAMTADWAHLPCEFLAKVSNDIINKVRGINRVVYDISSKPPATIEWE